MHTLTWHTLVFRSWSPTFSFWLFHFYYSYKGILSGLFLDNQEEWFCSGIKGNHSKSNKICSVWEPEKEAISHRCGDEYRPTEAPCGSSDWRKWLVRGCRQWELKLLFPWLPWLPILHSARKPAQSLILLMLRGGNISLSWKVGYKSWCRFMVLWVFYVTY